MKYFFKCLAIFIGLTVLLILGDELFFQASLPLSGSILFSAISSLILTLIYGWIDAVYIKKRQPGLENE